MINSIPPTAPVQPRAFFDSVGILRTWDTADRLPEDWTGIAKGATGNTYFVVGRSGTERSFDAIQATSFEDAYAQAQAKNLLPTPSDHAAQYLLCVRAGKSKVFAVAGVNLGAQSCLRAAEIAFENAGFDTRKMDTKWGDVVTKQKNFAGYAPEYKVLPT